MNLCSYISMTDSQRNREREAGGNEKCNVYSSVYQIEHYSFKLKYTKRLINTLSLWRTVLRLAQSRLTNIDSRDETNLIRDFCYVNR